MSCIPIAQQLLSRIVRGRYVMEDTKNPLELNYRYTVAYKNFIPTSAYYNTVRTLRYYAVLAVSQLPDFVHAVRHPPPYLYSILLYAVFCQQNPCSTVCVCGSWNKGCRSKLHTALVVTHSTVLCLVDCTLCLSNLLLSNSITTTVLFSPPIQSFMRKGTC